MIHDLINYFTAIDFSQLMVVVQALYHDLLGLVGILKGSSTAIITNSPL